MRVPLAALLGLLLLGPPLVAQDEKKTDPKKDPVQAEYQKILDEYTKAQNDFFSSYGKAKTDDERQNIFKEKYPQPEPFGKRMLELAEKNPKASAAVDALVWIAQNVRQGPANKKALEILFQDHLQDKRMGSVSQMLVYFGGADTEKNLRTLIEKAEDKNVQGLATMSLARYLQRNASNPTKAKESESLFERVIEKFGDIKQGNDTLAELAKAELFEIRYLTIGKTAPEIEGEDIEGKKFKLSDYRGKVVVLDFWGNW